MKEQVVVAWCVALAGMTAHARLVAQEPVGSGTHETVAAADRRASDTRAGEELLRRPVTLDITRVPLSQALDAAAASAKVPIQYRAVLVDARRGPVTLHVTNVPLQVALDRLLEGTLLRVVPDGAARLTVVDGGGRDAAHTAGIVSGIVRDGKTNAVLRGANVTLDDSAQRVLTDHDGRYRFVNVPAGTHRVTVRFVGFARQTKLVAVSDDQAATADFVLAASVNTLDQVVVTATGAQRVRELGHVVAQINADSLVREAPITSLSELLTARVPGLQVFSGNGGTVGGEVALRLRSQTTTALDPQPIVIVDGVRYKNTNTVDRGDGAMGEDARPFNAEPRSPLNDLNVNDIETVEVVKGPSASTLYGPDAANGVIIITTKRGMPGKTTWHVYAYPDLSVVPQTAATSTPGYRAWGHNPNTGVLYPAQCSLQYQAKPNPQCVLDSITVLPTNSNSSQYGVLEKTRPQWHSGASVAGGSSTLTYFFSGNLDSQTGAIRLSPFAERILESQLGVNTLGHALKDPNTQQMLSLHTNVSSQVNAVSTLNFIADYTRATQRAVNIPNVYNQTYQYGVFPPGFDTTDVAAIQSQYAPANAFLQSTQQTMNRLVATARGVVQPWPWLTASADIGADLSASVDRGVEQSGAEGPGFGGTANDYRRNNTGRSANLNATATSHPGILSFRSSVGAQYTYANLDGLNTNASNLAPGSTSITTAQSKGIQQVWMETASLGMYGEEVMGLHDRLFLTGSLRLDGSTTFGDRYKARPFPKLGASWIVSDEPIVQRLHIPGLSELRLRYSYGAASRYPTSTMKLGIVNANNATINGQAWNIFVRNLLSDPLVRPERTHESEWGADVTVASGVQLGLTWFNRRTDDQLNVLTVPYGFLPEWANVGDVAAHGFEASLSAKVLETRQLSVELNASYAYNTNKLLSLGSASEYKFLYGSQVVGYPLDASFGQTILSVADTAGGGADSIAAYREITMSPVHYLGTFYAPNVYTITPVVALLGGHVRISSSFDRQSGGVQRDTYAEQCSFYGLCLSSLVKTTSLMDQARILRGDAGPSIVSSDFTRWRELSVTSELPLSWRQKLWLSRASVSLQVRNLMLWTNYHGPDPESVPGLGTVGSGSATIGATGIPQTRSWALRFDVSP